MAVAYCLGCGDRIYLGRKPWVGQTALCDRCGADLEVTNVHPLILDWIDDLVDEAWEIKVGLDRELLPA